ncbi:hypothetical protein SAMN00808754_1630 [Thermanaeromonas toyohensis ToBE]|uniref:Uncharacterized protein n=1 Tax=Thermanaeromonas toyohensis ToBE TaxID=698762 RepID=A0A1W1VV51_9FIRM|nr:hypothetical protein [Thermanaeromonas toyohensis]SMB96754.1 hypothetical protein SAMN00808754_1630 [Thermanaeromonas toyohensis ToBE]
MGIEAYVHAAGISVVLGTYAYCDAFREVICGRSEDGTRRSSFPRLEKFFSGECSARDAEGLLQELEVIKAEFQSVMHPVALYCAKDGEVLGFHIKHSPNGVLSAGDRGIVFGVTEKGLFVESKFSNELPLPADEKRVDILGDLLYRWVFAFMRRVCEKTWTCWRDDGTAVTVAGINPCAPPDCVEVRAARMPVVEVFREIIHGLERLCRASAQTGDSIKFRRVVVCR